MIQQGKYPPLQKLEKVCALWESGLVDDPIHAELDRLRRPLLKKWESYARAHGRSAVLEYAREQMASADGQGVQSLLVDFCRGGLTQAGIDSQLPETMISQLREIFRRGALEALQYTEDDGEIPSLDMLRTRSLFYPIDFLIGKRSALAIFVTYFLGRNDVLHILDQKIPRVTLVDRDATGLDLMKRIYPVDWSYAAQDYKDYLNSAIERGERYDIVSCDQPLFMAEDVAWGDIHKIMKLCNYFFISNYTGEMLSKIGFGKADMLTMSDRLSEQLGIKLKIEALYPRVEGQAHHWVVVGK
jgi:hypothetical protein